MAFPDYTPPPTVEEQADQLVEWCKTVPGTPHKMAFAIGKLSISWEEPTPTLSIWHVGVSEGRGGPRYYIEAREGIRGARFFFPQDVADELDRRGLVRS